MFVFLIAMFSTSLVFVCVGKEIYPKHIGAVNYVVIVFKNSIPN